MKLVRFGEKNNEKPGAIDAQGTIRDLSTEVPDWTPETVSHDCLDRIKKLNLQDYPAVDPQTRLGMPLQSVGKVVGIGLNYSDHAKEAGLDVPTEPILFLKANSALSGPTDPIELPPGAEKTDWEVELGVVFSKDARNASLQDALSHVAGYIVVNDISDRCWQLEYGTQWTKGKSADTFCPIGPWLVTADEIPDPQNLSLYLELNGKTMQIGNSGNMVFSIQELIHRISVYTTLKTGDLMTTGTPPGVGVGMKPPQFLQAGDKLKLGIVGLGEQQCSVIRRS